MATSWLENFFVSTAIKYLGATMPRRANLEFVGAQLAVSDSAVNDTTTVTMVTALSTLVDVDFTAQPSTAKFTNPSTNTIAGVAWNYRAQGTPTVADVALGTGIRLGGGGSANPFCWASLLALAPTLTIGRPFEVWFHMPHTGSPQTTTNLQCGFTDASLTTASVVSDTANSAGNGWTFLTGLKGTGTGPTNLLVRTVSWEGSLNAIYSQGSSITDDVFCLRWDGVGGIAAYSGAWAAGWPSVSSMRLRGVRFAGPIMSGVFMSLANWGVTFGSSYDSTTTLTLAHLRVLQ